MLRFSLIKEHKKEGENALSLFNLISTKLSNFNELESMRERKKWHKGQYITFFVAFFYK